MHISLLVGPILALCVGLAFAGVYWVSKDPTEDLDLEAVSIEAPEKSDNSAVGRWSRSLGSQLAASLPSGISRWLQRQVDAAGRPDGMRVDDVLMQIAKWLLLTIPLALVLLLQGNVFIAALAVPLAFIMPLGKLTGAAQKRKQTIDRDLPSFLDVLAVTVSAGIAFRRALGMVADRFGGPIGEEVTTALAQIDNGASVRSAFKGMRTRSGAASMDEFVTAYLQAEELGAPLANSLNEIADEMRRSSAEAMKQRAAKVEPRVSLVTTVVMVPALLILILVGLVMGLDFDWGDLGGAMGGGG